MRLGVGLTVAGTRRHGPPPVLPPVAAGNGLRQIAYVARHDTVRGFSSVRAHWDSIDEISPSWWAPNADGSVVLQGGAAESPGLVAEATSHGVAVRPVLGNDYGGAVGWDWAPVSAVLNDPGLRATLVGNVVDLVLSRGYGGIDVDFEHPPSSADREVFTAFVAELADGLHAVDRTVTVTFPAKRSIAASSVWDYYRLGRIADQCRAMIYDDVDAGPPRSPSSLRWWRQEVAFLVGQIPASKLVLGAPTYGYVWNDGVLGGSTALFETIEAEAAAAGGVVSYETTGSDGLPSESARADWSDGGVAKVAYYENARSLATKAALVKAYNLAGVHYWRAGGEDPAIYSAVADVFAGDSGAFSIDVQPTADTTLDAGDTDNDRSGLSTLFVKSSLERRALLRFDVTAIPADAVVTSAVFGLYKNGFFSTDPVGRTYTVSRVTQPGWAIEGDNGNPAARGATWALRDVAQGLPWATPGGDFTTADRASATVPATNAWMMWGVSALVEWARVNGGVVDFLVADTVFASNHQAQFVSLEGVDAFRPKLTIAYTLPAA